MSYLESVTVVAIRLMIVWALLQCSELVYKLMQLFFYPVILPMPLLYVVILMAVFALVWCNAPALARKIVPVSQASDELTPAPAITASQLQETGLIMIGVYFGIVALMQLANLGINLAFLDVRRDISRREMSEAVFYSLELLMGLALIFGARNLLGIILATRGKRSVQD